VACAGLFDLGRIAALDLVDGKTVSIEVGEARQLRARAVSASGDTLPEAVIVWERIDVDSGATTFTIDSSGVVTALAPGQGKVIAKIEKLQAAVTVVVTGRPDLLLPGDSLRFTVATGDTTSAPLTVRVVDLTSSPGDSVPLAGKVVRFAIFEPAAAGDLALAPRDSVPSDEPGTVLSRSDASGTAAATLLRRNTAVDSAVVRAIALTATGDTVAGSPVRFVVYFEQE
jgi:hypothetical protein